MNIPVTGSLGYISTPLIQLLVKKGHAVSIISSKVFDEQQLNGYKAFGMNESLALQSEK